MLMWKIYWLTRLSSVNNMMCFLSITLTVGFGFLCGIRFLAFAYGDTGWDRSMIDRANRYLLVLWALSGGIWLITPSRKDIIAMRNGRICRFY